MTHETTNHHHDRGPTASLASAWNALCCLPATHAWFWLARSGPPGGFAATVIEMCASAHGAAPAIGLVLLDALPKLLVAIGSGVLSHG